jgi:hypothetical protein
MELPRIAEPVRFIVQVFGTLTALVAVGILIWEAVSSYGCKEN